MYRYSGNVCSRDDLASLPKALFTYFTLCEVLLENVLDPSHINLFPGNFSPARYI